MLGLLLASVIAADAPAVQWTAPPGCPDAATAQQTIARGLAPDSDLRVQAIVNTTQDGFAAQVDVSGPAGETRRMLESPECSTLLDAVALIAEAAEAEQAAAIEQSEDDVQADLVPEATPKVEAVEASADEPVPRPTVTPPASTKPRVLAVSPYLRATGRIGWGLTPVVDGGGGFALGLQWRRLRVETYADVLAPTEKRVPGVDGATVRVFAWSVGLRGCGIAWTNVDERVAFPVCGGAEVGRMTGSGLGEGLVERDSYADTFVALHAGPAVLARLASWASVYAGLDAIVLAYKPGFSVRGIEGAVYRPAPAGVRFTLGVEVHFPRRIRRARGM